MSILIVGYNSADLIGTCLSSIPPACREYSYEVLLVDQGDGSTEAAVAARFPDVHVVESQGNLGFAGGNNLLAASARGANLLLLNPDVELTPGAIDALLHARKTYPEAAAWGGVTLDRNELPDVGNTVHVPSLREMASRIVGQSIAAMPKDKTFDLDEKVEALSGGFVMIARSAWEEASGLDERYFLYCEEVDLFHRLARKGHSFIRVGKARAYHDIGHGEVASPMRLLYRAAGTMQFALLHWSKQRQYAAFLLIWVGALQRYVFGSALAALHPRLKNVAAANRLLALKPNRWRHGYDPEKGLLAQLRRDQAS